MKPSLQKRSQRSARRILDAAVELLAEHGVADFKMSAVAETSGVSVGGLYGRFAGREALLLEVKRMVLDEVEAQVNDRLDRAEPGIAAAVEAFVGGLSDTLFEAERLYAFVFTHSAEDPTMRQAGFEFHERLRQRWLDAVSPVAGTADRAAVAYELIVQSLLMRVTSAGSVDQKLELYPGFVSPKTYAHELCSAVVLYLTTDRTF